MPWVLVLRWLVRLAVGLAFWRVTTRRRAGGYTATTPPVQRGAQGPRVNARAAAAAIREGASFGWRTVSFAGFLIAGAVLVTAGLTTTILSPRWLGGVLLGLALIALAAAGFEARALVRLLRRRRRRRHDQDLRGQLN
jgi:uncharacterized membrane protein